MNCLVCGQAVNINAKDSTHQVNDNTGETYCSYECSAVATLRYISELTDAIPLEDLHVIVNNT